VWRIVLAIGIGTVAAFALPNKLNWRSDSPYLDSMKDVVNYKEGSGHGRVKQYTNSLKIVAKHPLLGVGPGNWPVEYPTVAPANDKSIDQDTDMTSNPWPSSDWVAMISERGIPAFLVFSLAWLGLLVGALRGWRTANPDEQAQSLALIATLTTTMVTGAFDAVLLIAIPALFAWTLIGAFTPEMPVKRIITLSTSRKLLLQGTVVVVGLVCIVRSATQIQAMSVYDASSVVALKTAARFDPGSYRIQIRLAELYSRRGNCAGVRESAGNAHALFPDAPQPKRLLRQCGVRPGGAGK
jgi:hypothetical protein